MNDLDTKIKSKFKLFSGVRSQEEDQKIYDRLVDLAFDEITQYLFENLEENEVEQFTKELENQQNDDNKAKVFEKYLKSTDDYQNLLSIRVDTFLNNLLLKSLNASSN